MGSTVHANVYAVQERKKGFMYTHLYLLSLFAR